MKVLSEKEFLKKLCSFLHRKTPSELGDKAAEFIIGELKKLGFNPQKEIVKSAKFSDFWYVLFHFIPLLAIALIFFWRPSLTLLLIYLIFLFSLSISWLDRPHLFSFLGRILTGESKNVIVKIPSRGKAKKRFILSAHYDTAHQSAFLSPMIAGNLQKTLGRFAEKFPPGLRTPFFLTNIPLGFSLAFMVSQLIGIYSIWMIYLELISIFILAVAVIFIFQGCVSPYVPGALDNGGGVAVLYGLARKIKDSPFNSIEVQFLFNSNEEGKNLIGMRNFLDRHGEKFDKETTFFVNIDGIGAEVLHYIIAEADIAGIKHPDDPFLISLSELLDNYPEFRKVTPFFLTVPSDATMIIRRGFRCLTISSSNKDGYYPHYHQLTDTFDKINMDNIYLAEKFAYELLEKVDFV